MYYAEGWFTWTTGAVNTTFSIASDLTAQGWPAGLLPQALFVECTLRSETVDTVGALDLRRSQGFAVSTSSRCCVAAQSDNGAATASADSIARNDAVLEVMTITGTVDGLLDVSAMDTFIVDDVLTAAVRVRWRAWAGLKSATITQMGTTTLGDANITTNNRPDALFFITQVGATINAAATDSRMGCGFCVFNRDDSVQFQAAIMGGSNDTPTTMQTGGAGMSGRCVILGDAANTAMEIRAAVTTRLSNGFTINYAEVAPTARIHFVLALEGGAWFAGEDTTETNTSTAMQQTGFGFRPKGVFVISHGAAETADNGFTDHDRYYTGSGSGTGTRGCLATFDQDAVGTSECASLIEYDEVLGGITLTDGIEFLMDIQSVEDDGLTFIMDDADAVNSWYGFIAWGDVSEPWISLENPLMNGALPHLRM